MLKARVLVDRFLIHLVWIKWVRATPTSIIDLNLRLQSWLWWMKLLETTWSWSISLMAISISLPNVFKRTIGLNAFGESYDVLLGLEITIVEEILKWDGQWPSSIQAFAMEIMFFKHVLSLRIILRCLHDSLLGSRVEELLYLIRELTNSSSAKRVQDKDENNLNSSRASQSIMQYWTVLKVECNACQKLSSSRHGQLLNLIASRVESFYLLTQFMSSHGPHFLLAISLILRLKNVLLVLFTVL